LTSKTIDTIWWPTYYRSLSSLSDAEKLCSSTTVGQHFIGNKNITNDNLALAIAVNANYKSKTKNILYDVI
jgi:hypothetical protein